MYIVVDAQPTVAAGYVRGFDEEGIASLGLSSKDFRDWLDTSSSEDLQVVQGFLLGEFQDRIILAEVIRRRTPAPVIAVSDNCSLDQILELFTARFDDVVRQPVHVREILARSEAIWRRLQARQPAEPGRERLQVYGDGRDPEIDGVRFPLPRRERHILECLVRNRGRWLTKTQLFNTIYGLYSDEMEESVVEGHVSKLRKKLRQCLGSDPIQSKRYVGYSFVG